MRHLIVEVNVSGGIDEVELIGLSVFRGIAELDRPRFDGDAPFPLDIHVVEELLGHIPQRDGVGLFQNAVSQSAFPMVDMGDDTEIADVLLLFGHKYVSSGRVDGRCVPRPGAAAAVFLLYMKGREKRNDPAKKGGSSPP